MPDLDWRKIMLVGIEAMQECHGCNPLGIEPDRELRKNLTEEEYAAYVAALTDPAEATSA